MANTANRNYPKPVSTNFISSDVALLQTAFDLIDADVAAVLLALAGKAAAAHSHSMGDVTGLSSALAEKAGTGHSHALDDLSDVTGAGEALTHYLLYKTPSGWVPGSVAAVLANGLGLVAGDLIIVSGVGAVVRLPKGTNGQVLKMVDGLPAWAAA